MRVRATPNGSFALAEKPGFVMVSVAWGSEKPSMAKRPCESVSTGRKALTVTRARGIGVPSRAFVTRPRSVRTTAGVAGAASPEAEVPAAEEPMPALRDAEADEEAGLCCEEHGNARAARTAHSRVVLDLVKLDLLELTLNALVSCQDLLADAGKTQRTGERRCADCRACSASRGPSRPRRVQPRDARKMKRQNLIWRK